MNQNQNPPSEALSLWDAFAAWCGNEWSAPEAWGSNQPPRFVENRAEVATHRGNRYIVGIDDARIIPAFIELARLASSNEIMWWARPSLEISPYRPMPAIALANFSLPALSEILQDVLQHRFDGGLVWHPRFAERPREGNAHLARKNAEKFLILLLEAHSGHYLPWTEDDGFAEILKAHPVDCAGLTRSGFKEALETAKGKDGRKWKRGRRPTSVEKAD